MDIDVVALQALMSQAGAAADVAQGLLAVPDSEITCEVCRCEWQ